MCVFLRGIGKFWEVLATCLMPAKAGGCETDVNKAKINEE